MQELFFEFKVDLKVNLKSRLNLMSCLKDQGFFKIRLNPSFLNTPSPTQYPLSDPSMTQYNVIEFSCYKFRGKRTKKHISNIRKIFGNFINLMCDLRTNFSLSFFSTLGY